MKKFVNKETELKEGENLAGFAGLAKICLDNMPENGWDKNSMKLSFACEEKLEGLDIGDEIELEDAEFDYLHERSQPFNMRWRMKHKDIVDYIDYLDEVKKQK